MSESFNNKAEQDLVRTSIDPLSEKDLNLDKVTNIEREKALSKVTKEQLKEFYSPEMEKGKELTKEQQNNKKAVINAIVDIANQPQKIEVNYNPNQNKFKLLDNIIPINNNSNNENYVITPQQIADEIY